MILGYIEQDGNKFVCIHRSMTVDPRTGIPMSGQHQTPPYATRGEAAEYFADRFVGSFGVNAFLVTKQEYDHMAGSLGTLRQKVQVAQLNPMNMTGLDRVPVNQVKRLPDGKIQSGFE